MEVAVLADELTAVGWRLAGARVSLATAENVASCLQAALQSAEVVLLTAGLAACVPAAQLQAALHGFPPLTLVIADLRREREPPDLEAQARSALGVLP
jgi:vacuolar-type H+-ATPase subunit F/Vma7